MSFMANMRRIGHKSEKGPQSGPNELLPAPGMRWIRTGRFTMTSNPNLRIRQAERRDIPHLFELNAAAYPDLIEDGVVFSEDQLVAHLEKFAAGQLVAELDGRLVGA